MSVELVTNQPPPSEQKRVLRLLSDARALRDLLTRSQMRAVYEDLEVARDVLSEILDRADGKYQR